MFRPPGDCPQCGEFVPAKAKACRACGACDKTGWSDDAAYDDLSLPDSAFEEEDDRDAADVRRGQDEARKKARAWFWRIVAALLLAGMLWLTYRGMA